MLPDIDNMEARCVVVVKVRMLDQVELCKICIMTIISFGIAMLTLQRDLIIGVCFM